MIQQSYGALNTWMFPGGGLHKNEKPEGAARREIKEEVGIRLNNLKKVGEYTSKKEYKKDTVFIFSGEVESKDLKIDFKEIAKAEWLSLENLPEISNYSKVFLSMWKDSKYEHTS